MDDSVSDQNEDRPFDNKTSIDDYELWLPYLQSSVPVPCPSCGALPDKPHLFDCELLYKVDE
jgi:hypothetical protein